jgi:hypothetical protein
MHPASHGTLLHRGSSRATVTVCAALHWGGSM